MLIYEPYSNLSDSSSTAVAASSSVDATPLVDLMFTPSTADRVKPHNSIFSQVLWIYLYANGIATKRHAH